MINTQCMHLNTTSFTLHTYSHMHACRYMPVHIQYCPLTCTHYCVVVQLIHTHAHLHAVCVLTCLALLPFDTATCTCMS